MMLSLVRALLTAGAQVRAANRYGVTPLALAAINGSASMVDLLLKAGADPNAASGEGETVLMAAARTGQPETLKLLLKAGADPNAAERRFGETALMWAAGHDHAEAIRVLVAGGAKPDAISAMINLPNGKGRFFLCGGHGAAAWRHDGADVRGPARSDQRGDCAGGCRRESERCRS